MKLEASYKFVIYIHIKKLPSNNSQVLLPVVE